MARQIVALLLATLIVACAAAASACENEVVELTPLTFQSLGTPTDPESPHPLDAQRGR